MELSVLEEKLENSAHTSEHQRLRAKREGWHRLKRGCITHLCLRSVYEERIDALRKALE